MGVEPWDEVNKQMSDNMSTDDGRPGRTAKGDRVEVLKILILAGVSFLAGFALVFLFLKPSSPSAEEIAQPGEEPREEPQADQPGSAAEPTVAAAGYEPVEGAQPEAAAPVNEAGEAPVEDTDAPSEAAGPAEGDAPPEVPPGKTPDGVALDGDAFYLKCWDDAGVEHKGSECDRLGVIEKRFSTRLYMVDKCRQEKAGEASHGKLSVASEVDFAKGTVSFWNGASSDIPNASQIGACLRTALVGLPVHGADHKFARYRVFYTVLFGDAAKKKEKEEEATAAKFVAGPGRMVDVVKDRVRVRKTPVDGDVIGKIGTGTQVRYIKKKDDWCNVVTPNNNEGWMICDALGL
jgi:hypothetical protein